MKNRMYCVLFILASSMSILEAGSFGDSFGGSLVGGLGGSLIGSSISRGGGRSRRNYDEYDVRRLQRALDEADRRNDMLQNKIDKLQEQNDALRDQLRDSKRGPFKGQPVG